MFRVTKWRVAASAIFAALIIFGLVVPAQGDATSDRAIAAAVRKGQTLFQKTWTQGGKSCAKCHASGRNKMTSARLKSYPKYDKAWRRVITGQQKNNHMIKTKVGGVPLTLGSEDINALEAYICQLR